MVLETSYENGTNSLYRVTQNNSNAFRPMERVSFDGIVVYL